MNENQENQEGLDLDPQSEDALSTSAEEKKSSKPVRKRKKKKKKKFHWSTLILVLIFLIGLGVLSYPTVSDWWNAKVQTRAIANYNDVVAQMSDQDYDSFFAAADAYNEQLFHTPAAFISPELVEGYKEALDVTGTGIMGYISIEAIDVSLPIYHGTDESVLQIAVGHLEGSSLPVGGENTHCVLSAHRGLPSARLFTDLDKIEVGDIFTITVLNRVLTYQVDQIRIVEPTQLDDLKIVSGEDYCTLMTCTPYGINSHRLLVRGTRIETVEEAHAVTVTADATTVEPIIVLPFVVIPLLLILMIILISNTSRKKKRKKKQK